MKDEKKINILDIELFLLSFFGTYHVFAAFINSLREGKWDAPGIIMVYWALFTILLADRMTYKKISNVFFWKMVFIGGICILIIKSIMLYPILLSLSRTNTADIFLSIWLFLMIGGAMILFIYRSCHYISKGE